MENIFIEKGKENEHGVGRPYNRKKLKIGDIRTLRIAEEYEKMGYKVLVRLGNNPGVDITVISIPDGKIRKVIECTNYGNRSNYICEEDFERYIETLTWYEDIQGIEMELVVSYLSNLNAEQLRECERNNIRIRVIGHQDLPRKEDEEQIEGWREDE
ncbi:MAG: hypothetical protein ACPLKS_07695 [Caldisericum exile]|uniref:hypothetical protein n=1 Tax=Caldisericum exile TaxID=693075 RepID=UPI003C776A04